MIFNKNKVEEATIMRNFSYLDDRSTFYFDSSCQTLRPYEVILSEQEYYTAFNACGHRVKYEWGKRVDNRVAETRELLLKIVGKNSKDYTVAFCLNTTHGINTVLHQLNPDLYSQIITSEIEHNSVFLNAITWGKRNNKKRIVYKRHENGSLEYSKKDLEKPIVIINETSNFDGRKLTNLRNLEKDVHSQGGILLLDGAQTFGHDVSNIQNVDFDAIFGSGHKMYAPSIGFIIIKKSLLKNLDCFLIGGGTVSNVEYENFDLISDDSEIYARIEAGLQNFAGIIGLGSAIRWKQKFTRDGYNASQYEESLRTYLYKSLLTLKDIHLLNTAPSSVVSFYSEKIDSHKLGAMLSSKQIMCRTGYFCCHYYLKELNKYPPLIRISIGLNNSKEQIDFLVDTLNFILRRY